MEIKDFYTIEEVAELLSITPRTVRSYLQRELLQAFRPPQSKRLYILRSELLSYIQSGEKVGYEGD